MIIYYSLPLQPSQTFLTDADTVIVGRNPSGDKRTDIDLEMDEFVSHRHARITCENNRFWVEDLGSANGTWVNGVKISDKTELTAADKVQVGWTILEVALDPETHDPAADSTPEAPTVTRGAPSPGEPPVASVPETDEPTEVTDLMEFLSRTSEPQPAAERGSEQAPVHAPDDETSSESDGTIIDLTTVVSRPYAMSGDGSSEEMLTQSMRQLTAFNDLSQMLAGADSLDALVQILVEHLQKTIPNAQRGAVLMPDKSGELLLKAHWPPGDHSVSMTWIRRAYNRREPFIWSAPEKSSAAEDLPKSAIFYKVQSAIYVPLLIGEDVLGVMYVDNFFSTEAFFAADLELMRAIAGQVATFVRDHILRRDLQREEELRSRLARQFPPKIADRILARDQGLRSGGERTDPVTILISDVRGFTALSAKMDPDDVVGMLNEMFDAFVPIVFEHDGVVDKYIGDSILAVFGSPEKDDRQCEKAVRAALEMQRAVDKLVEGRRVRRLPVFEVGVGIHTGEVIHGFIGSSERREYTVIGDAVNRASRYCDGADAGEVVISKTVYERVYHAFNVRPKKIRTKHPEAEPDLEAFVVKGLKSDDPQPDA